MSEKAPLLKIATKPQQPIEKRMAGASLLRK
jgi:hypothetical protein